MDSLENLHERFEALERRTQMVEQRLRWWRGLACGVLVLALLSVALPSGKAADVPARGMAERMAILENKLAAMSFDDGANEVVITGANLRIVNGLENTETTNGLGNLIVGYNEERGGGQDIRTGSHSVVVGKRQNFSSFGGLVVGQANEISGAWASVSGGAGNMASGFNASVSGGGGNTASGLNASVSGGFSNTASGLDSVVSGGEVNTASGRLSAVSGGKFNTASGENASVSGGAGNTAQGSNSAVSGGQQNTASGDGALVSGGDSNIASNHFASVSGGFQNTAGGNSASVSGGHNRSAPRDFDWAAGPLFADF